MLAAKRVSDTAEIPKLAAFANVGLKRKRGPQRVGGNAQLKNFLKKYFFLSTSSGLTHGL
jgi:hypothetical protein